MVEEAGSSLVAIVGPTASGKSALAVGVARALGAEVLSADSRLVYRGMDIGTAKPTTAEQQGIVHHGMDLVDPDVRFSLAAYLEVARPVLEVARAAGRPLVVTGGTGLYMDALLYGYDLPRAEVPPTLEASLRARSLPSLLEELDRVAPEEGSRVDRANRRRVERALAVVLVTGVPAPRGVVRGPLPPSALIVGIDVPPPVLSRRIAERVGAMFTAGLVEEVEDLAQRFGHDAPGLQAIGYQEVLQAREQGRDELWMRERIEAHTRQYAKRQRTWYRRNADVRWIAGSPDPS